MLFLVKIQAFYICWERLIKGLTLQLFLQKFKPSKFLILGRKDLLTLTRFFLSMIIIIVFVITSVFHFARIWHFLMKNFNTFLSLAGSLLTFVPFKSLLIISFHIFLYFPLAKLPITLKVLHFISNKTFSSIKVFFTLNLHPCYSILI